MPTQTAVVSAETVPAPLTVEESVTAKVTEKLMAVKAQAKRKYTKRGTTVPAKRVVLLDGTPVGRGRPAKDGKGKRTVVYVPKFEKYNLAIHGLGVPFRSNRNGVLRRLKVKKSAPAATVSVEVIVEKNPDDLVLGG